LPWSAMGLVGEHSRPTFRFRSSLPSTGDFPAGRRIAVACCLVGLIVSGLLAVWSDGVHHDDDLTHFLYARWARHVPGYLVHEWGRPGFTVLYFLPAQIGWLAARWFSGLLTVLAAWFAYRVAERMVLPHAWLVAPLTLVQPMFLQLSYTTLTETPLAFYTALALWLLVTRRCTGSAVVFSLALVTRHEAVVWVPIWVVAMWHRRARPWGYLLLGWAPLVHNLLTPHLLGKLPFEMFLSPGQDVQYGSGSLWAMPGRALLTFGPGMVALACLGTGLICPRSGGPVVASMAVVYFLTHAIFRYLGLYATAGYPRLLVPLCPLVALLAAAGFWGLADWTARRWTVRPVVVAAAFVFFWFAGEHEKPWWLYPPFLLAFRIVTVGVVLLTAGMIWIRIRRPRWAWVRWVMSVGLVGLTVAQTQHVARPWRMSSEQRAVLSVVEWLKDHGYGERRVLAPNVWVHLFWPNVVDPGEYDTRRELAKAQPGTLLIWDRRYSPAFPRNMPLKDYLNDPNYRLLVKSWPSPGVFCYAFEKR